METRVHRVGASALHGESGKERRGKTRGGAARSAVPAEQSTASCVTAPAMREDASRFCPLCSQRLESRRCKLTCNVCGYYMSCADYY